MKTLPKTIGKILDHALNLIHTTQTTVFMNYENESLQ